MKTFALGAYPTMITPYNQDNTIDKGAVRALVDWYWERGCDGIFASCQSSEIHCLTLEERIMHAALVREEADHLAKTDSSRAPMTVVASGHISDGLREQAEELNAVAETGVDALILISNRMDIENTGDDAWCVSLDTLLEKINPEIPLGIYECPRPYKRLLTPAMLRHCTETGRFAFIKDTCCDDAEIARRIQLIKDCALPAGGYRPLLFNANAQTLLRTLRAGAAGYCGVMCNFHPELYVWLCKNFQKQPEQAELLHSFLCTSAFLESLAYPCIAKYHLDKIGVRMLPDARTCDVSRLKDYDRMCVGAMDLLADHFAAQLQ